MLGRDKVLLGRCWGLSPQLKSVEFSFLPNVVHELQSIVCVKPLKKVLHFMGSGPQAQVIMVIPGERGSPIGMPWTWCLIVVGGSGAGGVTLQGVATTPIQVQFLIFIRA